MSNFVTTDELPVDSEFDETNDDPENFRLQARLPDESEKSVTVTLKVIRGDATISTTDYVLEKKKGEIVRGEFLRLVSDDFDDKASGSGPKKDDKNQTIKVELGDKIKASYPFGGGKVESEISVGRPVHENNNDVNHKKHDIREVKVRMVVFKNAAGTPCVTSNQIDQMVIDANERFAQSGIKLKATVDFGPGKNGIDRPPTMIDGFDPPNILFFPKNDEKEIIKFKDGDVNTIDIFLVETLNTTSGKGIAFPKERNKTGNAAYSNWIVLGSKVVNFPNTFPHEIMHILLNKSHRRDPDTALFKGGTDPDKAVGGTKRIGPYPDASAVFVGESDTTTIRGNSETLP